MTDPTAAGSLPITSEPITFTGDTSPRQVLDQLHDQLAQYGGDKPSELLRQYAETFLALEGDSAAVGNSSADADAVAKDIAASVGATSNASLAVIRNEVDSVARHEVLLPRLSELNQHVRSDPVVMFKGEFTHATTDLTIDCAGITFAFRRYYRSQVVYSGPLGANWGHAYSVYVRTHEDKTLVVSTGELQEDIYTQHPLFGSPGFDYYVPPPGVHATVLPSGASFVRRDVDGLQHKFEQDPAFAAGHRLHRIEDRHGNYLELTYDDTNNGVLARIVLNHPNRVVRFSYDELNRITQVEDFSGRAFTYAYDDLGNLTSCTTPPTDRYPYGLTTTYEYSTAGSQGLLRHNLQRITDPAAQIYLENGYGIVPGSASFNRVIRQRQGEGEVFFEYEQVVQEFDFDYKDAERPAFQTNFFDRNGQPVHYIYNKFGNLLLREESVIDAGAPRILQTRYRYNRDGAIVAQLSPEGAVSQYLYGRDFYLRTYGITDDDVATHPNLTDVARRGFGKLLAVVKRAKRYSINELDFSRGVWGDVFPDVLGGLDPADGVAKMTYETDYGQPLTVSDPRFTERADPNHPEPPTYAASLITYEYQGPTPHPGIDPNRLLAKLRRPTPTRADGTPAGPVVEQYPDYDPAGRLKRKVDPAGVVITYDYFTASDGPTLEGYLRRVIVDPAKLALTTEYEVDALGRVTRVRTPRAAGAVVGRFESQTEYNALDQVVRTIASPPFSYATRFFYDRNGKLERMERDAKDETGTDIPGAPETRTYRYDEQLNLRTETRGGADLSAHLVIRNEYDASDMRVATIFPNGNVVSQRYDVRHQLVAIIKGPWSEEAAITRSHFDGDGMLRRSTNARGYSSEYVHDSWGRLLEQRDALGNVLCRDYDKAGNTLVERWFEAGPGGAYVLLARTERAYDVLNRCIREAHNVFPAPLPANDVAVDFLASPGPGKLVTTTSDYDPRGRVTDTHDPLGRHHHFDYGAFDRPTVEQDPGGHRTTNTYDAEGNLVRRDVVELVKNPTTGATVGQIVFASAWSYDEMNRVHTTTDSLGNVVTHAYDSRGNLARRTDALGNVARGVFDIYGRQVESSRDLTDSGLGGGASLPAARTIFGYDSNSNLTSVTDALGRVTRFDFDTVDRRTLVTYPDGSTSRTEYDPDSNISANQDANGLVRRMTRDALGRVVRIDVDRSRLAAGVVVEGATFETYEYDGLGRIGVATNDFCACTWAKNSVGWDVREDLAFAGVLSGTPPATLAREFTDDGEVVRLTYPGGRVVRSDRNELGQIVQIANEHRGAGYPGSAPSDAFAIANFEYAGRRRARTRLGNGVVTTHDYDALGRPINDSVHDAAGPSIVRLAQLFDGVGNMRFLNELWSGGPVATRFAFDSMYRLTRSAPSAPIAFAPASLAPGATSLPHPLPHRQAAIDAIVGSLAQTGSPFTWSYDLVGNRVLEQRAAGGAVAYAVNTTNEYTAIDGKARTYDANGNLLDDGARTYRYDSRNRLVNARATGALDLSFFHDAHGRRIAERQGGQTTAFVYDGLGAIAEFSNGVLVGQVVYDDGLDHPVDLAISGAEYAFHCDVVGSVRALTDANGKLVGKYRYGAFGDAIETTGPANRLRFAGRPLDPTLGSYDFRTRQYDPSIGRFLQRDGAGFTDGVNLYSYAGNNPLTYVDPFGTSRESAVPTSMTADMKHDIAHLGGSTSPGQFVAGGVAAVVGGVAEIVGWIFDAVNLPFASAKTSDPTKIKAASDLGRSYLIADERNENLDQQRATNLKSLVWSTATVGLNQVPDALTTLADPNASASDKGGAFAMIGMSVWGAKSVARELGAFGGVPKTGAPPILDSAGDPPGVAGVRLAVRVSRSAVIEAASDVDQSVWGQFDPVEEVASRYAQASGDLGSGDLSLRIVGTVGKVPYRNLLSRKFIFWNNPEIAGRSASATRIPSPFSVDEAGPRFLGGTQNPFNQYILPRRVNSLLGALDSAAVRRSGAPPGTPILGFDVTWLP